MSEVKKLVTRYSRDFSGNMQVDPNGSWVLAADAAIRAKRLTDKIDAAQSELAALREELETSRIAHHETAKVANDLQQRLTAAEQRNAELTQALERGKLWLGLFRSWFGDYGVSKEDHMAIIRTLRGLPHPPSEFDTKPTES